MNLLLVLPIDVYLLIEIILSMRFLFTKGKLENVHKKI